MEEEKEIRKQDTGFTQISNKILYDKNLSLKAKGLYCYMFSKPIKWYFSADRIAKENNNGIDAIYSAFDELLKYGFIQRKKLASGRFVYTLMIKPYRENPSMGKSQAGKTQGISNTELKSNTIILSNTNMQPDGCEKNISEIINLFKPVNPFINFGNKTQRAVSKELIEKFSYEKLKMMIEKTVEIQGKKYAPTITSPYQFKNKIGEIKIYFDRQKDNKIKITNV